MGMFCRGELPHPGFDGRQVVGGEGLGPEEVVIEPVLDGRADAGLGPGEELEDGVGQEVGGAVPQDVDRKIGYRRSFSCFTFLKGGRFKSGRPYRRPVEF